MEGGALRRPIRRLAGARPPRLALWHQQAEPLPYKKPVERQPREEPASKDRHFLFASLTSRLSEVFLVQILSA
jgi:hypothetical protein